MGWLVITLLALAAACAVRARFWPYRRCPACEGRKGRGIGSTDRAYNRCWRCGGSGELVRPAALMWPRWRGEARRNRRKS